MYINRVDAGHQLAQVLRKFHGDDSVVLALPRGGVVLGAQVARELKIPLGVVLVCKIGHPASSEYAIGAVVEGENIIYSQDGLSGLYEEWIKKKELEARQLIEHRRAIYYTNGLVPPRIDGKTVILVDDGIATGLTMEAAVRAVKKHHPKRVVVAVPVASGENIQKLKELVDEVIVLDDPYEFKGVVGAHYQHFNQITDDEVVELLREANYELQ